MARIRRLATIALCAVALPNVAKAAEVYVSLVGNDQQQGVGTCDKPYKTLQKAVNDLPGPPADNVIWLLAYDERLNIQPGFFPHEPVVIDNKKVTIKPYYVERLGACKPTETKALIKPCKAANGNPGAAGVHGVLAKGGANVNLRHLEIFGQEGGDGAGTNASAGNGGDGIRAETGALLTKFESTAKGGKGGKGTNESEPGELGGRGADGGNAEKSKDENTHVKNYFKARAQGGKGGNGGAGANGPGGDGGAGGAGASTENGGSIEGTPTGQGYGGSGGEGGSGTPPGTVGPAGLDESGLQITDIPEGDADGDGTPDDLDPCPENPSPGCSPTGNCMAEGACYEVTAALCAEYEGIWGGPGTDCPESEPATCTAADPGIEEGISGGAPSLAVHYAAGVQGLVGVWLPREMSFALQIYNVAGERMATLHHGSLPAGRHDFSWSGETLTGAKAASGVYFVRFESAGHALSGRLLFLR